MHACTFPSGTKALSPQAWQSTWSCEIGPRDLLATRSSRPQDKYSNLFLGFGPEDQDYFSLELTYNYGKEAYDIGTGFGHFALAVPDVYKAVDSIKSAGAATLCLKQLWMILRKA